MNCDGHIAVETGPEVASMDDSQVSGTKVTQDFIATILVQT